MGQKTKVGTDRFVMIIKNLERESRSCISDLVQNKDLVGKNCRVLVKFAKNGHDPLNNIIERIVPTFARFYCTYVERSSVLHKNEEEHDEDVNPHTDPPGWLPGGIP